MTRSTIDTAIDAPLAVEPAADRTAGEVPVFAARSAARPRALRIAGRAAAALVALWLVGLLLGTFGLGYLPGIPFPGAHRVSVKPAAPAGAAARHAPPIARTATAVPLHRAHPHHSAAAVSRRRQRATGSPGAHHGGSTSVRHPAAVRHGGSGTPAGVPKSQSQRSTHSSSGTPRRSSAIAPGSRSHAQAAPGRTHSTSVPQPGTHATAKGPRAAR